MFSISEREEILEYLVENISKLDEIIGIVIVGSGSHGFRDKYSDIDLALVYDENYEINNVFKTIYETVSREYRVATVLDQLGRNLQVILLDNYLEIDIGYYTTESIIARRKNYKVVYDRSGSLAEKLSISWDENSTSFMGTTSSVDIKTELFRTDANLWYCLIHTVNSFLRGEKYRCYYELEELRRSLISLIGKRVSLETKRYRDVDRFDTTVKDMLDSLFIYPKSNKELEILLNDIVSMFYDEFTYWDNTPRLCKEFLLKYVIDNLD